ncbi:MAG: hypothetical protein ACRBN8_42365 [Nannocystales bacterium]
MSHLRRYLEQTAALAPDRLEAALRRQQIYGGSLDTVLLELAVCDPQTLCELLGQACGLDTIRPELLEDQPRPWDVVPASLQDIGWAVPLGVSEDGSVLVAVHPDLPNERLGELYRAVPRVLPLVTPECGLEKVNAERVGSVVPQRYAVLFAAFMSALRLRPSVSDVGFPIVPVEAGPTEDTAVGKPVLAPPAEPPADPLDHSPDPDRVTRPYTETEAGTTPDSGEESTASDSESVSPIGAPDSETESDSDEAPRPPDVEPIAPEPTTPVAEVQADPGPDTAEPAAGLEPDPPDVAGDTPPRGSRDKITRPPSFGPPRTDSVPAPPVQTKAPPVRFTARGTMIATSDPLHRVFNSAQARRGIDAARSKLAEAVTRDEAVDALVSGALVLSDRVAVFRLRGSSLRGLTTPHPALAGVRGTDVPLEDGSSELLQHHRWVGTTGSGALADAIGSAEIPCTLHRVDVAGRPVLALYVDHEGREFLPAEANLLDELCKATASTLETIVLQQRSGPNPAVPPVRHPPSSAAAPEAEPETPPPATPTPLLFAPPPVRTAAPELQAADPNTDTGTDPEPDLDADLIPEPDLEPEAEEDGDESLPQQAAEPPTSQPQTEADTDTIRALHSLDDTQPPAKDPLTPPPAYGVTEPPGWSPPDAAVPELPDEPATSMHRTTQVDGSPAPHFLPPMPEQAAQPAAPRFVPPVLEEADDGGIIPLSSPIDQPTVRGRIVIDDDDFDDETGLPTPPEGDRAIEDVLRTLSREEGNLEDLRALGPAGLQALATRLPGPLEVLRRDLRALPAPSAHGPLVRAAIRLGPEFVPYVLEQFENTDPDVRFYAAFLFQELRDPRAMEALSHLAFDGSTDVRVIAMRVLETYSRYDGFEEATFVVRRELDSSHRTHQLYAARAVGTLRDVQAIPKLIGLLSNRDRFIQEAALESLCSITGQQHGLKPHRWKSWHQDQGVHHRVEWIIESLRHRDLPVRRWAHDELVRVTGHRVPFSPLGDRSSREVAYQAWLEWWQRHGQTRLRTRVNARPSPG